MRKFISLAIALAMLVSVLPMAGIALAAEPEKVTVDAVRGMFFNNAAECKATDGDNVLIASNGSDGWAGATSFTDLDGTVTEQSSLQGSGFSTPRNAVFAFELPDVDYNKIVSATLSFTIKNVKQVTANERLSVYGNSIKDTWAADTTGRDALGHNGPTGLEMLGFTTMIKTGNQTGETASGETVTMSSQKLAAYLKQLKDEGYTEATFRLANNLGGIRVYDASSAQKPTLTIETGDTASVTVKSVLADGSSFGVADKTFSALADTEFTYGDPKTVVEVDGVYYILNTEKSTLAVTPTMEGSNVIMLVYDKFEGTGETGSQIAAEGATCWFADPRSLTVKADGVNKTYVGYIDNHGSVKAFQYDNLTKEYAEVLVRSNFQPDDHNNPTFLELPDGRIMIFYSRHTDEACFYYRISKKPYDITVLGEEKRLATENNTTYPSPFIMSDDPEHIYLCWRGIGWHPTMAQLEMPTEANGYTTSFSWGPKQIVNSKIQGDGCRPYAKYTSDGVSKIWITYTGTHPDNVGTNPVYCNYIDINDLSLHDVNGNILSANIETNLYEVTGSETDPATVVDRTENIRDWVWEIRLDNGKPVIAMVKISSNKKSHDYWYAYYNGSEWVKTDLPDDPNTNTFFHQTPGTENCYSGGMTIDKADPHIVYVSMPVEGVFGKVFEIVKWTLADDYSAVVKTEYITENSRKNNARPYIANGSEEGDLRLTWMNGDYYYWIYDMRNGAKGFPTRMMTLTELNAPTVENKFAESETKVFAINGNTETVPVTKDDKSFTISMELLQNDLSVGGTLLKSGNLEIALEKQTVDPYDYAAVAPKLTVGDKTEKSQNLFSNSDWFSWSVNGTGGQKGTNSMGWINYSVVYDGKELTTYVNGLIDATMQDVDVTIGDEIELGGINGIIANVRSSAAAFTQAEIKAAEAEFDASSIDMLETVSLGNTTNLTADITLPAKTADGQTIEWTTSDATVITATGIITRGTELKTATLTAKLGDRTKEFVVTVAPKGEITENLVFGYDFSETYVDENGVTRIKDISGNGRDAELHGTAADLSAGKLDLSANTADGWDTNGYVNVPYDFLQGVRSYTVVQKVKGGSSVHPRLYDFGPENQHTIFTRADKFTVGIKNGSTQLADVEASLDSAKEQWVVTRYDAATGETAVFLDGAQVLSSQAITHQAFNAAGGTTRNYIGRTQWWDYGSYAPDNQDFNGTIDNFMFFNTALTEEEIAAVAVDTPSEPMSFTFDGTTAEAKNVGQKYVLAVAQYAADGSVVKVETTTVTTLKITKEASAASAKAMLWSAKDEMKPLAAAIEVKF